MSYVENTFAPEYEDQKFTPNQLFAMCKYGFPMERLSPDAQDIVRQLMKEYVEKPKEKNTKNEKINLADDPEVVKLRDAIWKKIQYKMSKKRPAIATGYTLSLIDNQVKDQGILLK